MQHRFFRDAVRYIGNNIYHPSRIITRGFNFFITTYLRRSFVRLWVSAGFFLQRRFGVLSFSFEDGNSFIKTANGTCLLYSPKHSGGIFDMEFGNDWELKEIELLLKHTPNGGIFFDIGASFGWYSLCLAKQKKCRVHAFEPNMDAYRHLCMNIKKNKLQDVITVNKAAVSDRVGTTRLVKPDYYGSHLEYRNTRTAFSGDSVRTVTLDSYCRTNDIARVDAIKCDVEGAEWLVLQGGKKILKKFRPCILVEIEEDLVRKYGKSPEDLFSFFRLYGYNYFLISEEGGVKKGRGFINQELSIAHNFFFYTNHL